MTSSDREMLCMDLEVLLVDYVEGTLQGSEAAAVEAHCAACVSCADAVAALSEVPSLLRSEGLLAPQSWEMQRRQIMGAIDEIVEAEAARRAGFDARLLLPLAAALAIALAGIVSLQGGGAGRSGMQPARAALEFGMADPAVTAELSEVLGEPLVFSDLLWSKQQGFGDGPEQWEARGVLSSAPVLDELSDDEIDEVERMLGLETLV